jgi:hypothetical protein
LIFFTLSNQKEYEKIYNNSCIGNGIATGLCIKKNIKAISDGNSRFETGQYGFGKQKCFVEW